MTTSRGIRFATLLLVLASSLRTFGDSETTPDQAPSKSTPPRLFDGIFSERNDLREPFYRSREHLNLMKEKGLCLVIGGGVLEGGKEVSTNECSTVEEALTKHGSPGFGARRQIRIVQQDAILQSPRPRKRDLVARKELLALKLVPGDVVIVTRKEL